MQVLAASPAETAITAAVSRGAALGGTSAGAAVESRTMINGYVGDLGPADGLRRDSTLMWWGDDPDLERGLDVGSRAAIFDQHFHQRGRLGRSLSTLATADERFGGRSPVGVGVDYATGVRVTGDRILSGVFGDGSCRVLDLESLRSTHRWVGSPATLSARRVVTHLMTEGTTYDLRRPRHDPQRRDACPARPGARWCAPGVPVARRRHRLPRRRGPRRRRPAPGRHRGATRSTRRRRHASSSSRRRRLDEGGQRLRPGPEEGRVDRQGDHGRPRHERVVGLRGLRRHRGRGRRRQPARPRPGHGRPRRTAASSRPPCAARRWSSPTARPPRSSGRAGRPRRAPPRTPSRTRASPRTAPTTPSGCPDSGSSAAPWSRTSPTTSAGAGSRPVSRPRAASSPSVSPPTPPSSWPRAGARVAGASVVVADGRQATTWTSANGALGASGVVLDVFGSGEAVAR